MNAAWLSTPMTQRAMAVAINAHAGQTRWGGEPYITHPMRVAELVALWGGLEEHIVAALLHDVVEDTATTVGMIQRMFGSNVARHVIGVTRGPQETYPNFIIRSAAQPGSRLIKWGDVTDNLNDGGEVSRLSPRYNDALVVLGHPSQWNDGKALEFESRPVWTGGEIITQAPDA